MKLRNRCERPPYTIEALGREDMGELAGAGRVGLPEIEQSVAETSAIMQQLKRIANPNDRAERRQGSGGWIPVGRGKGCAP